MLSLEDNMQLKNNFKAIYKRKLSIVQRQSRNMH